MNDIARIRGQFPSLSLRTEAGRELVFFDGPGGTQVPEQVIAAVGDYYRTTNSNTDGVFGLSIATDALIAQARGHAAAFVGGDPEGIAFGQNMTSLNFNLVSAFARTLRAGDEIVVTRLDHDANVSPWLTIAEDHGLVVRVVELTGDLRIDLDDLRSKLSERTRAVAFTYVSNAVGTLVPVREIVELANGVGAIAWLDAVAAAAHHRLDVGALDVDVLLCSPYKFFGPHQGIAWVRPSLIETMVPNRVRPADLEPLGHRFETGTLSHESLAGVVAAIDYLASLGEGGTLPERLDSAYRWIAERELMLTERFMARVGELGWRLCGPDTTDPELRTGTFGFLIPGGGSEELARRLGEAGICTWNGNFYAQGVMESLGVDLGEGLLRVGVTHYNTEEEIDYFFTVCASFRD